MRAAVEVTLMSPDEKQEAYEPEYTGFDKETTRRAQATADRSQDVKAGGEHVDASYMEDGAAEYKRRTGDEPPDMKDVAKRKPSK